MRRLLCLLLVLTTFAAACGGSDGDPVTAATSDTPAAADDATDAGEPDDDAATGDADGGEVDDDAGADDAESGDADGADEEAGASESSGAGSELAASVADEEEPLSALLGFDGFDDPAFLVEQQRRVDEQIQICMRADGFEYTPQNLDPDDFAFGRSIAPGLSDEEFAEQYGYGVAATAETLLKLTNQSLDDPNNQMLADMSEGEASAWQQAMLGADVEVDSLTGELLDPETGEPVDMMQLMMQGDGCATTANREVFGSLQALFLLESEFADLGDRINGDRRVVEITAEWSACMAEAGYDYAELGEPPAEFNARLNTLIMPLLASVSALPGGGGSSDPIVLTPDQQADLDALQQEEIGVATRDLACASDNLDELDEIRRGYELDFIEQNADALQNATG